MQFLKAFLDEFPKDLFGSRTKNMPSGLIHNSRLLFVAIVQNSWVIKEEIPRSLWVQGIKVGGRYHAIHLSTDLVQNFSPYADFDHPS